MSFTLAFTGKGGVGKTTLAALAVRWLGEKGRGPVLAVDADPNTCLDALLGVDAVCTVGGVREEARAIVQAGMSGGISKQELLDMKIAEALVEAETFDLIAMGRSEGPGCYCYANNVLRGVLSRIAEQYPAVVVDNEAGLENLSRRTVQQVDQLVFVTDPSSRGLKTARRLYDLALEMEVKAGAMGVILNRVRGVECLERAAEVFTGTPVKVLGGVPENAVLAQNDAEGLPVFDLPADNEVYISAETIFERILSGVAPAVVS
jgi:CO dehydrogenase maturation factor